MAGNKIVAGAALMAAHVAAVAGHGSVVHPRPRNAVDGELQPWASGVPYPLKFGGWCPIWGVDTIPGTNKNVSYRPPARTRVHTRGG